MTDQTETPAPVSAPGTALAVAERKTMNLGAITGARVGGGGMAFLPQTMEECVSIAQLMAKSDFAVPPLFRGNPGACLAVAMQAARWEMDPFAVCSKAYATKAKDGSMRMAYEAQLFAAVVNVRAPIIGRLALHYSGEGNTRAVKCIGIFRDTGEPREVQSPILSKISPRNSPLWVSDPDQQLAYYVIRAWARRWTPEILLGVYSPDELQVIDEAAAAASMPVRQVTSAAPAPTDDETGITRAAAEPEPPVEAIVDVIEEEPAVIVPGVEVTAEEARVLDDMRPQDDEGAHDEGQETAAAGPAADEPTEEERAHDDALAGWEAYLTRAKDGLLASDLKTEADLDDYATHTKAAIAAADGITEDEKDDLRARFVSAYLQRKRDMGLTGRTRR